MPASLTNQIRLGFSLGWRIWTPNEVGFYAKTLAHSYFIFMVLKAKFFQKKLWVVNYSLFVGIRKYYVFIEFLQFGIKTKEERTYWKKIMYISLLVRHANYLSNARYSSSYEKLTAVRRYFNRQLEIRLVPARIKSGIRLNMLKIVKKISNQGKDFPERQKFNQIALNKTSWLKKVQKNYRKFEQRAPLRENSELFIDALAEATYSIAGKITNFTIQTTKDKKLSAIKKFRKYDRQDISLNKKLEKNKEIQNSDCENYEEYLDNTDKEAILGQRNIKPNFITIATLLRRDFKNTNLKVIPVANKLNLEKQQKLKWYRPNFIVNCQIIESEHLVDRQLRQKIKIARAFILETPRAGVKDNNRMQYSICGGPRKRLFRNLKRSFQGKYIVKYANLVWFWEKISRLVTFYIISVSRNLR